MYPVGYYDLREAASPVPVVSTAFRPDRSGSSWRATRSACSPRCWPPPIAASSTPTCAPGSSASWRNVSCSIPALITRARQIAADGGCSASEADEFVAAAVSAFALSREPIDLALVRRTVRGVGGRGRHRRRDHHPHQPPDPAGARHRRAVPRDDGARHRDDRRHPGPTAVRTDPMCCCARRHFARWPNRAGSATPTASVTRRQRCGCASVRSSRAASR